MRLIDADELIKRCMNGIDNEFIGIVNKMPTSEIVRCKNCIHRPIKGEDIHDIDPPTDDRGYTDYTCPCLNADDYWYSWYPSDDWFCAEGKAKGVNGRI